MPSHLSEREERANHWRTLFGPTYSERLSRASWRELRALAREEPDEETLEVERTLRLPTRERVHLRALLSIFETWRPTRGGRPDHVGTVADVVTLIAPRCRTLRDATLWLLSLDETGHLVEEVLVQLGPHPMAPPPVHALLRHAILKEARQAWMVEFRPEELTVLDEATCETFAALAKVGASIGLNFRDWVVLSRQGVTTVEEERLEAPRIEVPSLRVVA